MIESDEVNKKSFIDGRTYIPLGFLTVFAILILFGADLRSQNSANSTSISVLNQKIESEIDVLRAERKLMEVELEKGIIEAKKENQFLRERMIKSINELRRLVYRIDGKLEHIDKFERSPKKEKND
jgi:hypothetical protein